MDRRNNFWYFGDKPSFRISFSKDAPLPVDDSPVEISSSSYPPNSIPSDKATLKELLRKEIDNLLANIYQKQVGKSGIIDTEAGKNKYLLKISNDPTRGNTAENSVSDEVNDVNTTPETDSSTKPEGNASVMPQDRASEKNQRFNRYPKPNEQRFNRYKNRGGYSPEKFDVEEHYTEGDYLPQYKADSEDYFAEARHDTSPVSDLSPRPRYHTSLQIK
ncbi:hypothetical protein TNCV_3204921 [Trichonephila clavipes]|nr:hypothetical protein TNCV_3204921 [Trichonephila clavipes]